MATFDSAGVEIAYYTDGEGPPVLLIHGFASSARVNWFDTGWVRNLTESGRKVIAIDNRGHGASDKLYDPSEYSAPIMAEDAARLINHLGLSAVDVVGYSMGARIAAFLTIFHQSMIRSAVLAGLAENMIKGVGGSDVVAGALEAPSLDAVTDPTARAFRIFAEQTGSDLLALAACMRSSRQKISVSELAQIMVPVLVAAGTKDDVAGPLEPLVDAVHNGEALPIPGRDHMRAVGDKVFKQGVLDFLTNQDKQSELI